MKTIEQAAIEWMHNADEPTWEDCFEAGAAFAQQWISVEDELPENSDNEQQFFLKFDHGKVGVCYYFRNNRFWNFNFCEQNPTHWRPIELK